MNGRILDALAMHGVLVSDGAMGTELMRAGLAPGECPESWNASRPDDVRAISRSYFDAGSDMVLTNTFGASRWKLAKFDLADRQEKLVSAGVKLAVEGGDGKGIVALSIGPTGEFIAPLGTLSPEEVKADFAAQVAAAAEAGADGILCESMSALEEITLGVEAAREAGLCALATMTFSKGPAGYRTMMGNSPAETAKALEEAGADVVGANCGVGVEDMIHIVAEMREATAKPILVHANAGMPELKNGQTVFPEGPEEMAAKVLALREAGAQIIGGCCGTTPDHIRAMAAALASVRR